MLYIHPDECIDCGVCVAACPADAIHEDNRVPPALAHFTAINREFFELQGASDKGHARCDHPRVAAMGLQEARK